MERGYAIPLGEGGFALVSACDYEKVKGYNWWREKRGDMFYARTSAGGGTKKIKKQIYLHRLILDASRDKRVDHKNQNGLDNRRGNIRLCTQAENMRNVTKMNREHVSSKYKGVAKAKAKWRAAIKVNYKQMHIGTFNTEEEAALAYDDAASKYFGDFACINFPSGKKVAA